MKSESAITMSLLRRKLLPRLIIMQKATAGLIVGFTILIACSNGSAAATIPAPAWQVTDLAVPSVLSSQVGKHGKYDAVIENVGGTASEGNFTIKMNVPQGLAITGYRSEPEGSCAEAPNEISCTMSEAVVPSGFVVLQAEFEVVGAVARVNSTATVVGGGATSTASDTARMRVGGENGKATPGIAEFKFKVTGPAGEAMTQAGGHPTFVTTSMLLNNMYVEKLNEPAKPVEAIKDLVFYLPLGMLGNPAVTDPCPSSIVETTNEQTGCPSSSRVGTILPMILNNVFADTSDPTRAHGIYSVEPEKGYAAEFAFTSNHYTFSLYATVVRRAGAYMLRIATPGVPAIASLIGLVATFYGDVREPIWTGQAEGVFDRGAFISNPTDCSEGRSAREAVALVNTWEQPVTLALAESTPGFSSSAEAFSQLDGCELLPFSPSFNVRPETTQADAPSGYGINLEFGQAPNNASGLATPPLKDVSIALPDGTTISPSSATGLEACQETGSRGINIEGAESTEIGPDGLQRPAPGHCPQASEIATLEGATPLLRENLTGHLFLATPACGGAGQHACRNQDAEDGGLFGLYLELQAQHAGVVIKLKGHASIMPGSGRITATFTEGPQFPVNALMVKLKRGARAPLANPQTCGIAASLGRMMPWSSPATPTAVSESAFSVDWDGAGGACPAHIPFGPLFAAGGHNAVAGASSDFDLTVRREDREQDVSTLSTTLPKGLLANLTKVVRCPEPQASEASLTACPTDSQLGTTTVAVGSGSDPYYVTGKVFFTGPYDGAPFGLSVVVPAVAGPFNLGNVLVRAKLYVDPHTSQVTAVSDSLPQERDGVPLRLRVLNIALTNREFVLNPTNCTRTSITGTVSSTTGAAANVSSPFAVAGCKNLPFKPKLTIVTEATTTKENGTGVTSKIAYPTSGQANVAKVVIGFPKQIPVRLQTLQKACLAAVFNTNPASCPAASNIGTATAHTPILVQPLSGPVYLVSNGSAKFPDVEFVLQGEGITLDIDGQSFVSKDGALQVTFASVPDAPFSTFETVLPAGRYSQFTSVNSTGKERGSQCGENLIAPVKLTGQNGAQIAENVQLQVVGCRPSVSIVKARVAGAHLTVTVKTTLQGRLTVGGIGLKTLLKPNLSAGTHQLTVSLTGVGKAAARAHRKLDLNVGLVGGKQRLSSHRKIVL